MKCPQKVRQIFLAQIVDVKEFGAQIKEKQTRINTLKLQGDFFTEQLAQYEDIDFFVLSDDEKKKIANELIERILLSEDGNIEIIYCPQTKNCSLYKNKN